MVKLNKRLCRRTGPLLLPSLASWPAVTAPGVRVWPDNRIVKGVGSERLILEEVAVCRPK